MGLKVPAKVTSFAFTPSQMRVLLIDAIGLCDEYIQQHGFPPEGAAHQAVDDTLDGLRETQWLIDNEELEPMTGQIYP